MVNSVNNSFSFKRFFTKTSSDELEKIVGGVFNEIVLDIEIQGKVYEGDYLAFLKGKVMEYSGNGKSNWNSLFNKIINVVFRVFGVSLEENRKIRVSEEIEKFFGEMKEKDLKLYFEKGVDGRTLASLLPRTKSFENVKDATKVKLRIKDLFYKELINEKKFCNRSPIQREIKKLLEQNRNVLN